MISWKLPNAMMYNVYMQRTRKYFTIVFCFDLNSNFLWGSIHCVFLLLLTPALSQKGISHIISKFNMSEEILKCTKLYDQKLYYCACKFLLLCCELCPVYWMVYTMWFTICGIHCVVYTMFYTMFCVYTVFCTLCSVHLVLSSSHCHDLKNALKLLVSCKILFGVILWNTLHERNLKICLSNFTTSGWHCNMSPTYLQHFQSNIWLNDQLYALW